MQKVYLFAFIGSSHLFNAGGNILGGATKQFEAAMVLCGRGEGLVSIKFQGEKGATNSIIIRSINNSTFSI